MLLGALLGSCAAPLPTYAAATSGTVKQGIAFYNKGYIQKAIPVLERAVKQSPNDPEALLWLAKAYKKQGGPAYFDKARQMFERVLEINPNHVEALVETAEILSWTAASRNRAVEMLMRADQLKPGDPAITKRLSQVLYWEGRYQEALQLVEPFADRFSDDQNWMATYAAILSKTGHTAEAVRIFEELIAKLPAKTPFSQEFSIHQTYAMALFQNGQRVQAKDVYNTLRDRLAKLPPEQQTTYQVLLGALAYDLALYDESLAIDTTLPPKLVEENPTIQLRMARALLKSRRFPEAIDQFQKLYTQGRLQWREKVEYADILVDLGYAPDELPQPNLIEILYLDALKDTTERGEVHLRLARHYAREGERFEDALREYWTAVNESSPADQRAIKQEFLDVLKTDKRYPSITERAFQELMEDHPSDPEIKGAFAEYLSYQESRRPEAIQLYLQLVKEDPANLDVWKPSLERVLSWGKPNLSMIPTYQEVLEMFPDSKEASLAMARAYQSHPKHRNEARTLYQDLYQRFPNDERIKREWASSLISDEKNRRKSLTTLKRLVDDDPTDTYLLIAYGKLLSYDHQITKALRIFDEILRKEPENKDALMGKAYTLMFDGKYLASRKMFQQMRHSYPTDIEVALGLAEAEKQIGRYDKALKILKEVEQYLNWVQPVDPLQDAMFIHCDYETLAAPVINNKAVYDFSILPYSEPEPAPKAPARKPVKSHGYAQAAVAEPQGAEESFEEMADFSPLEDTYQPYQQAALDALPVQPSVQYQNPQARQLSQDLERLDENLERLKLMQQQSSGQINQVHTSLYDVRDTMPTAVEGSDGYDEDDRSILQAFGQYAAIDHDTNPLLSGMGRFRTEADSMEKEIYKHLRPMARFGGAFLTQQGEPSTVRLRGFAFPNQLSLSLTPQLRVRGGITPRKLWQPRVSTSPRSTMITDYSFGATAKYWDHVTLDGDMAILHFNQSNSVNLLYQAMAKVDFNDYVKLKLGGRRIQNPNSLLSYGGYRPARGPYEGDLVGQAMENMFFMELNTYPLRNVDMNAGYELGVVTGHRLPDNFKQQAFFSLGYTHNYARHHAARLGYEFLFFGYDKNATFGFFNLDEGTRQPLVLLNPIVEAPPGSDFGGYFSPRYFLLNAMRMDFRGSFFNKFLEYRLGGSLGVQTFNYGRNFATPRPTSLAANFDGNLLVNFTDWLTGYVNGEYLDGGGQFNRWRFGGGVIVRPDIPALSPVFHKR